MKKFKLKNGLTVIFEPRKTDSVAIEVNVHVGSNHETAKIAGISHFLEHMMFEGTKKRTAKEIGERIENVGGDLNAATTNERTFYYAKVPKKHFKLALDLLADMMQNPLFDSKRLEKERNVVLEEIKMTSDQPLYYQWILFESKIYKKFPTKNPVYGSNKSVKGINRTDMVNYFKKWYIPNNMVLTIVGDVKECRKKVQEYFGTMQKKKIQSIKHVKEPKAVKNEIIRVKKHIQNAYVVLGYKTVERQHKDSYVLDLISAIFCKGLSGRIVEEIRNKRGLVYSVGCAYDSNKEFGFLAFYLNTDKSKVLLCRDIIVSEIDKLSNLTEKEIKEAKEYIEGKHVISLEDTQKKADQLAFWEFIKDATMGNEYMKTIKSVSKKDILRVANKYLDKYTMTVLESK